MIKRPVIPTVAFGEGSLDRSMVDVIAVTGDGLEILEDGGETRIPLGELGDGEDGEDGAADSASGRSPASSRTRANGGENERPNVF